MSMSLVYTRKIESMSFDCGFKRIIEKRYRLPYVLNHSNIKYLEELVDGGHQEAQKLIDAINKYDEITLEYK